MINFIFLPIIIIIFLQTDGSLVALFNFFLQIVREQLHIVLAFSPIGDGFRNRLRKFPALVNCCTIDWFQVLFRLAHCSCTLQFSILKPEPQICLKQKNYTVFHLSHLFISNNYYFYKFQTWPEDALLAVAKRFLSEINLSAKERQACIDMCQDFHTSTQTLAQAYLSQTGRRTYVTPTSYLELINTFKDLIGKKRK